MTDHISFLIIGTNSYFFVISTKSGEAIKIDEYVPTIVPKRRASVNHLRLSGPKKNNAKSTIKTVDEVRIDRVIVSWIDLSIIKESHPFFPSHEARLERIRSITTIVSLIE